MAEKLRAEARQAIQTFRHSHHAERALTLPRPSWRGRSHQVAAVLSVPLGIWLTVTASPGAPRVACAMFAAGVFAVFAASGLNHWRPWSPHTTEIMVRIDHTGIYLVLGTTVTAFAVLGLSPGATRIALWTTWVAVAVGILIEWLPFASPRGLTNGIYLTIGWGSVIAVPMLVANAGFLAVALLVAGGLLYTIGVVVVSKQRPNPNPEVFGYHEIWHLLVIAATALHYVDVAFVLR
ncbi:MAG: hemolysin III [Glaciecola sp.]|jgi:hemolysin III